MRRVEVKLDNSSFFYDVVGDTEFGEERVLLLEDDNLIAGRDWADEGYCVAPFIAEKDYEQLCSGMRDLIIRLLHNVGVDVGVDFKLTDYHKYVDDTLHLAFAKQLREGFQTKDLPIDPAIINRRISEICGVPVSLYAPPINQPGFWFRIVRPSRGDNNPPHRDVWLDFYRHCVNCYVPVAGSNRNSSLPLAVGSHLWKESEIERTVASARVNGNMYTVPAVIGATRPLEMIRPDPAYNEVMVFSPYLIHGGAANMNTEETRVSLEIRFWRNKTHNRT